ncbi:Subtilisin-like serine protease [Zostera marina]|uniref:Subtilisin-like serine protease n=1 Tax=Zostera marina TaxID=29655 RepID=A0A0K9PFL4_ZOSMR|nr:Subtilisin-like serine protease [Zostera marina]
MKIPNIPCLSSIFILFIFITIQSLCSTCVVADASENTTWKERRAYIVHVEAMPTSTNLTSTHQQWHESFIPTTSSEGLLYSFKHVMNGFAAMLTEEEVEALSKRDEFLHAQPSKTYQLATTYSPKFLGLEARNRQFWEGAAGYGKGVVIGVIDTGITPLHQSFNDYEMPPPPKKWKGRCEFESQDLCNNKIIGARSFNHRGGCTTPMDKHGHGTHTAGIAAGRFVKNASVLGSANGTASGIAPDSHLAIYNVCDESGSSCPDVDILAGIEAAIEDGVDVLSISLAIPTDDLPLYKDLISIASFKAVIEKGVVVSASAGNSGPEKSTVKNTSPWIITVGASTLDRRVRAVVKLDNGMELEGQSAYQPKSEPCLRSLVYPESQSDENSTNCLNLDALKNMNVRGKIVVCDGLEPEESRGLLGSGVVKQTENVKNSGGSSMIRKGRKKEGLDTKMSIDALLMSSVKFPMSAINYEDGETLVKKYIKKYSSTAKARIDFLGTEIGGENNPAPGVASFSARGPATVTPGFIKPDIIAPGVNILAASHNLDDSDPPYVMMSGTSMSCPHISGVTALLKSAHPHWSSAMIKSAIITTSDVTNTAGKNILDQYSQRVASFQAMGSGHVNPVKANNPGLVYDSQHTKKDYVKYLCGLGYTGKQVSLFLGQKSICSDDERKTIQGVDLNYPSMIVDLTHSNKYRRRFSRIVTNVGRPQNYTVSVTPPHGVSVTVRPKTLTFKSVGQRLKFSVDVRWDSDSKEFSSFLEEYGDFTWVSSDRKIKVRSPIIITKEKHVQYD